MKITYITRQYPELSETFVTDELRALRQLGHEIDVFAPQRGNGQLNGAPSARYFASSDYSALDRRRAIVALALRRPRRVAHVLMDRDKRFGLTARQAAALGPLAQSARSSSQVHAQFAAAPTTVAQLVSQLSGVPFSFTAHAYDIYTKPEFLERKISQSRFVVTVCEYNRRYLAKLAPNHATKIHVIRCGVDLQRFQRGSPYDPHGPLLAVGRLVPQKGFEWLIRALAGLRDRVPEALVVGDGPLRDDLQQLIVRHDAPVRLLGARPHEAIQELLERASAFVLPCVVTSDGQRDAMPVAVKEAMAMELPVVATDEVGLPEEVGPDRGVLVPAADPAALRDGLLSLLLGSPGHRQAMGRAGRAFAVANLDLRQQAQRLADLFATA